MQSGRNILLIIILLVYISNFTINPIPNLNNSRIYAPNSTLKTMAPTLNSFNNISWIKSFDGERNDIDRGYDVIETRNKDLMILGSTKINNTDIWLLKTDKDGNLIQENIFGGPMWDHGSTIIQTLDGGYAIAGYYDQRPEKEYKEPWLIKITDNGTIVWNRIYEYSAQAWFSIQDIVQTPDNGFLMSISNGVLVKTNSDGIIEWNTSFDRPVWLEDIVIVEGGYVSAGFKGLYSNLYLVKIDFNGEILWENVYENSLAQGLVKSQDGGFFITSGDAFIKTDSEGGIVWKKNFIRSSDAIQTADGGIAIVGLLERSFPSESSYFLKMNQLGFIEVNITLNVPSLRSLTQLLDGSFVLVGGQNDIQVVKINVSDPEVAPILGIIGNSILLVFSGSIGAISGLFLAMVARRRR